MGPFPQVRQTIMHAHNPRKALPGLTQQQQRQRPQQKVRLRRLAAVRPKQRNLTVMLTPALFSAASCAITFKANLVGAVFSNWTSGDASDGTYTGTSCTVIGDLEPGPGPTSPAYNYITSM